MDALTFLVEISKALAWPISSVSIAYLFRKQVEQLLLRITKGKLGPAEFEFEQAVRELATEAPPPTKSGLPTYSITSVRSRATSEPRAVVLDAWLKVESALQAAGMSAGVYNALSGPGGSPNLIYKLQDKGVIDTQHVRMYKDLRSLRNRATHETDFTPSSESVVSFVELAGELESAINRSMQSIDGGAGG